MGAKDIKCSNVERIGVPPRVPAVFPWGSRSLMYLLGSLSCCLLWGCLLQGERWLLLQMQAAPKCPDLPPKMFISRSCPVALGSMADSSGSTCETK